MTQPALRLVKPQSPPIIGGRPPAHDVDAEADVVGELIEHPELVPIARGICSSEDFFHDGLRIICQAIYACHDLVTGTTHVVTPKLVVSWLKDRDLVQRVTAGWAGGGANDAGKLERYLNELTLRPSHLVTIAERCERVRGKARVRELDALMWRFLGEARGDYGDDPQQFLDRVANELHRLAGQHHEEDVEQLGSVLDALVLGTEDMAGLSTGLPELNMITGGFQRGDCWTITAPPGVGKTAYVIDRCVEIAKTPDAAGELTNATLLFSMEMPKRQCGIRAAAREALVDGGKVKNRPGLLDGDELAALDAARTRLREIPFHIDGRKELSIEAIRSTCHRAKARLAREGKRLALVGIDYYQLCGAPDDMRRGAGRPATRAEELDVTGKRVVHMAEELDVPVLLLAQLTRDGKQIADCSSLRKHTQNWLNLKCKKPPAQEDERDAAPPCEASFEVRKQRGDKSGKSVACWFHGAYQRFSEEAWLR